MPGEVARREEGPGRLVPLAPVPYLQIWFLSWPAGTGTTGWHDHGESAGAFLTVSDTLGELTAHGHRHLRRTPNGGQGRTFGPNHIHNVFYVGLQTTLSVHLYAPRLTAMTRYAATPAGFQVTGPPACHAGTEHVSCVSRNRSVPNNPRRFRGPASSNRGPH